MHETLTLTSLFVRFKNLYGVIAFLLAMLPAQLWAGNSEKEYLVDDDTGSFYITETTWANQPTGGDTLFISHERTKAVRIKNLSGTEEKPLVIINYGGQVVIDTPTSWGALTFENCRYIKVSGKGHPGFKYGFKLSARMCGLAFSELSSDCEAENVKISHDGFFGIVAKKDYGGNPPTPAPIFSNLVIHDCFVENVTEGMYLGETKSPGMEFKHVRIYNNIVRNTGRESLQIANMIEDVEIYNNTFLNAGNDNEYSQRSLLQIGDKTVANVYNNILIGAPAHGIICMGQGNNVFSNNYISECKGAYIDNRKFTEQNGPIVFSGNFFVANTYNEIIENRNELNTVVLNNNSYNAQISFFKNESGEEGNFILANNRQVDLEQIEFKNPGENDYTIAATCPEEYQVLGAPSGPEFFDVNNPDPEQPSVQIVLDTSMIVDARENLAVHSSDFLVDEQDSLVTEDQHPTSPFWQPYRSMTYGPYHVYFDLGQEYHITNISMHDMNGIANLEISTGIPGKWQHLFTEPCDKYKRWKSHDVSVTTRYVQLTIAEYLGAAINEIQFFGYPVSETNGGVKSANIAAEAPQQPVEKPVLATFNSEKFTCQNPVQDKLTLNLGDDLTSDFNIEIYNLGGTKVFSKSYGNNCSNRLSIDVSACCNKQGLYVVRYSNKAGIIKNNKFIKQ